MEDLKKKRKVVKTTITTLESQVQELLLVADTSKGEYESRLNRLEELFKTFNTIQEEIESSVIEEEDFDEESKYHDVVERKYFSLKSKLLGALKLNEREQLPQMQDNQQLNFTAVIESLTQNQTHLTNLVRNFSSNPVSTSTPITIESQPKIPLPVMHIPIFGGNYKEWSNFFDMYQSVVHNNNALSPVQKFQYLKQSLKGEAASTLKHLPITEANYTSAYELLIKKYDKEEYIIDAHLETLFDCPAVKHDSADELRNLSNTFEETTRALKALNLPTSHWDCWLNYLLISKLDKNTQQLWRRETSAQKRPTFEVLLQFIEKRIYELTTISKTMVSKDKLTQSKVLVNSQRSKMVNAVSILTCIMCKENHYVYSCPSYLKLNLQQRREIASKNGLCYNCLKGKHYGKECRTLLKCNHCGKRHHSTLHDDSVKTQQSTSTNAQSYVVTNDLPSYTTVLPTTIVYVKDAWNNMQKCRALLDSASELTLISESCVHNLGLKRRNGRISLTGVGQVRSGDTSTRGMVELLIATKNHSNIFTTQAFILPKLTGELPAVKIDKQHSLFFKTMVDLADPDFDNSAKIDIILGCDLFFETLLDEKRTHPSSKLIAHKTVFGWVITGKVEETNNGTCLTTMVNIDHMLRKFWEIEEPKVEIGLSVEDQACEEHFKSTHQRLQTGSYMVRLPFRESTESLGDSSHIALKRLFNMEKRLKHNNELAENYKNFMLDYLNANHMEAVSSLQNETSVKDYFLPHHGVWKKDSSTTRLRVVFDGSCPSSSGVSLNEILSTGPKIHNDLVDILLRFRLGKVGYVADIRQMFRQILVHPEDRKFQKIFWRTTDDGEIDTC